MARLQDPSVSNRERVILSMRKAMARDNPLTFIFYILLIPLFGLGLLLLFFWWLDCLGTRLILTDRRTILRKGILSRSTNEVLHNHVRNIQTRQSLFQRIMGVGAIGISSSGQSGIEIWVSGIPDPDYVKSVIDQYRFGDSVKSAEPIHDRTQEWREAAADFPFEENTKGTSPGPSHQDIDWQQSFSPTDKL